MNTFDATFARAVWREAHRRGATAQEHGWWYEQLAKYLLEELGEFDVRWNLISADGQADLLVRNLTVTDPVIRDLGTYLLAECKNWDRPASAPVVKVFLDKVRSGSCHAGLLISRSGLTGQTQAEQRDAVYTIRKAYHRDGTVVLVVRDADLQQLIDDQDLRGLLVRKYEAVRFDQLGL